MKSFTAFAVFFSAAIGAQAATADRFELKAAQLNKTESNDLAELVLSFQDKEPVSGVCDLTLSRFEYVDALKSLIVTLKPAPFCAREDYGRRQGVLKWQLPGHLYQNANLKIIVNDRALTDMKIVKGQIIVKTKP